MKAITFTLLFILINMSCFGQDYFEWISPKPTGEIYQYSEDKLTIKVRVKSSHPTNAKFDIQINTNSLYKNTRDADVVPIGGYIEKEIRIPKNSIQGIMVTMEVDDKIYTSKPLKVARGELPLPRLFILSIGPTPDIEYTDNDAIDFAKAFSRQDCGSTSLYSDVVSKTIVRGYATAASIESELKIMAKGNDIAPNDVFILFIASHGNRENDVLYIHGHDFKSLSKEKTTVTIDKIYEILDPLIAKKFIFIDACRSGVSDDIEKSNTIPSYHNRKNYTILTSSKADEISYHDKAWKNGAFTESLLEALSGKANKENEKGEIDDIITPNELFKYVKDRVPELVKKENSAKIQTPTMPANEYGDYPLFRYDKFCAPIISGGKEVFYQTTNIPQGKTEIGSIEKEKGENDDEKQRMAKINKKTEIGIYEVTNAEYCEFLNDENTNHSSLGNWIDIKSRHCKIKRTGIEFSPKKNHEKTPIVMVSWYGAIKFAEWFSAKDCIYDYDLPTADQWEYAARGGPGKPYQKYSGTNNFKDFNQRKKIMPVGSYIPNSLGIHDMNTNVSEWCKNIYAETGEIKNAREVRGGNFTRNARQSRTAKRYKLYSSTKRKNLGFRLIRTVKKNKDCD